MISQQILVENLVELMLEMVDIFSVDLKVVAVVEDSMMTPTKMMKTQ